MKFSRLNFVSVKVARRFASVLDANDFAISGCPDIRIIDCHFSPRFLIVLMLSPFVFVTNCDVSVTESGCNLIKVGLAGGKTYAPLGVNEMLY